MSNQSIASSLDRLTQENPRAVRELLQVLQQPPKIGSVKLSWRDGKLTGAESIRQTY